MKIFVLGPSQTGKSTILAPQLAQEHGIPTILHCDDHLHHPWPDIPNAIIQAAKATQGSWILEGCQGARVLRSWMNEDASFAPDLVVWASKQHNPTKKQVEQGKGIKTTFDSILPDLKRRNVKLIIK